MALLPVLPALAGQLTLPDVLADHMVLQRDIPVKIWGKAAPGASILVAFAGKVIDALSAAPRTGTTGPGMRSSPPAPAPAAAAAPAPASQSPQTVMFGTWRSSSRRS